MIGNKNGQELRQIRVVLVIKFSKKYKKKSDNSTAILLSNWANLLMNFSRSTQKNQLITSQPIQMMKNI